MGNNDGCVSLCEGEFWELCMADMLSPGEEKGITGEKLPWVLDTQNMDSSVLTVETVDSVLSTACWLEF